MDPDSPSFPSPSPSPSPSSLPLPSPSLESADAVCNNALVIPTPSEDASSYQVFSDDVSVAPAPYEPSMQELEEDEELAAINRELPTSFSSYDISSCRELKEIKGSTYFVFVIEVKSEGERRCQLFPTFLGWHLLMKQLASGAQIL